MTVFVKELIYNNYTHYLFLRRSINSHVPSNITNTSVTIDSGTFSTTTTTSNWRKQIVITFVCTTLTTATNNLFPISLCVRQ